MFSSRDRVTAEIRERFQQLLNLAQKYAFLRCQVILSMDELNLDQTPQDINKEEFQLERLRLQVFVAATDPKFRHRGLAEICQQVFWICIFVHIASAAQKIRYASEKECDSEGYEEEFVKNLYETIIANGKRLEELERAEKMRLEELERAEKMRLEELERAEKMRLEELVKEQALKEKELQLKFDLESTWKDFTFEITNYLDEWLIGLEINTFQDLKDLMVVDQLKKRANASMKDHFLDNWANLKSATQIAELFDNYEDVRKGSVNGHEIDILRDTGATIDLVCAKYINPSSFSGENVWVKQPLSPELVCLPLAVVEISGNFGTVQTKAAVCGNHLNQHGRYLLGNKTAELIKGNLGYNFLPVEILNAVQTRSQVKAAREERGIDSGDAKKGEDEVIIVSSDAEDEILILALQEYVPELALLRVTRENLINAQKIARRLNPLYEQAASQVQVTNQVYSLEKELLVKNREDKLGNVVKLIVVPEGLRDPIKSLCHEGTSAHLGITKSKDKLNRYFYWPNCYRDMEQFVKTCDQCQRAGKPNDKKESSTKIGPCYSGGFY
ncbi:retrovirus-related Pol polyprotein from transposon 17.6 [Trichonephila clavipes]|nr:retrovirus-related Pol polyprotein from transposon 17.6 [Trichonephila clavipes]